MNFTKVNKTDVDPFDLILGNDDGKLFKTTSVTGEKKNVTQIFKVRPQAITALARYEDYLLIAKDCTSPGVFNRDSEIYRCILDWTKLENENENCAAEPFARARSYDKYITSLVVVGNDTFFGRTDGLLHRCATNDVRNEICHFFYDVGQLKITGLAYDSSNEKLYISTESGRLIRCGLDEGGTYNPSCSMVFEYDEILFIHLYDFTAVYVAYDAVWIGVENGRILKCPLTKANNKFACSRFQQLDATIHEFGFRNDGYLYGHARNADDINALFRCDPETPGSCQNKVKLPEKTSTILIAS